MRGTPKLNKRPGSPFWYITFSEGRRSRRFSTGTGNRSQAERVLAQFLLERKKPQVSDEILVIDMLERYEAYKAGDATVGYNMKHLKPFFKSVAYSQVCNPLIREYTDMRLSQFAIRGKEKSKRKVSPSTVRRELDTLGAAFGYCRREGWIQDIAYIEKPKASKPRERWMTHKEVARLFAAAKHNKKLTLYIEIALNTGQRPSSILELKWFQVDLDSRLIHFNPEGREQTHKHRPTVYINDSLLPSLLGVKKRSEYVLGGIKSVKHAFRRACERAGLKGVTPYTLRHTAITWAVREGHSLALAGQLAGHKDPRTTMRYAKHDPSFTAGVVGSLATGAQLAHKMSKNVKFGKRRTKKSKGNQGC